MVRFLAVAGNCCLAMFSLKYEMINRIFDNVLVIKVRSLSTLAIKGGARKLPQSFFLTEVGPPNNNRAAFVGRFNDYVFAFFLVILNNVWQFAAFPYIWAIPKAAKH